MIVAGQNHLKLVENTLKEFKDLNCLVLIEPEGRNTAPAIFAAAKYIQKQDKESEILVIPSDHHYEQDVLSRTVDNAMKVKQKDQLITFGIKPTSPEVGYGYIHHTNNDDVLKKIILFKEKPDLETARKYLSTNEFYWNSGINIFNSDFIIQEFSSLLKESNKVSLEFFKEINSLRLIKRISEIAKYLYRLRNSRKSSNTYTSEFLGKWSDVGSWQSIKELNLESTENDNAILGEKIFIDDSRSNLIYSQTRTVGVSGVDNLAIIDTPDALLITNLNKRENANKILDKINDKKKTLILIRRFSDHGAGMEQLMEVITTR